MTIRPVLLGLVALAVAAPSAAGKPAPCAGTLYADPAGDAMDDPSGTRAAGRPAGEQADITAVFLNPVDGVLTANLAVKDLTEEIPADASGVYYYLRWSDDGGRELFVSARHTEEGWSYHYGESQRVGYVNDGATNGSRELGPDGVVEISIPPAIARVGSTLHGVRASTDLVYTGDDEAGYQSHADVVPDDSGSVVDARVAACDGPAAPSREPSFTSPATTPVIAEPAPLPLSIARVYARGQRLDVRARAPISDLLVQFRRTGPRGPVVASLRARSLRKGPATLKSKSTRLRRGTYTVLATGTVDGSELSTTQTIKVKN